MDHALSRLPVEYRASHQGSNADVFAEGLLTKVDVIDDSDWFRATLDIERDNKWASDA